MARSQVTYLVAAAAAAVLQLSCYCDAQEYRGRYDRLNLKDRFRGKNEPGIRHVTQPHGMDEQKAADDADTPTATIKKRPYVCKFTSQQGRNALITKSDEYNDDLANTYSIMGGIMSDDNMRMLLSARTNIGIEKCELDHEMTLSDQILGDIFATTIRSTGTAATNHTSVDDSVQSRLRKERRQLAIDDSSPELTAAEKALNMIRVYDGKRRIVMQGRHRVKVCIADTGYALGHPSLPSKPPGVTGAHTLHHMNTISTFDDKVYRWDEDANGHGTHIAGILSAINNDNGDDDMMVQGVGNFDIVVTRALDDRRGARSLLDVMTSVHQCIDAKADIINLSLGCWACPLPRELAGKVGCCPQNDVTIFEEFLETISQRALVVAAAGNLVFKDFAGAHNFPASFGSVVSVGTINQHYNRAQFSNQNEQLEFVAPGVSVPSTDVCTSTECTYRFRSGTSMSTGYISGSAAMCMSHYPTCTSNQIRNCLAKSARICNEGEEDCAYGTCDRSGTYGHGVVDTKGALSLLDEYGCACGGNVLSIGSRGVCDRFPEEEDTKHPCVKLVEKSFNHKHCKYLKNNDVVCPLQGGEDRKRNKIALKLQQSLTCNSWFDHEEQFVTHTAYTRVDRANICSTDWMTCGEDTPIKHVKCNSDGYAEVEEYFYPDKEGMIPGRCRSAAKEGSGAHGYCYFKYQVRCDCPEAELCTRNEGLE